MSAFHPVIRRKEGLYFPNGDFFLDPRRAVKHAIITHAHADHAIAGSENVYCTAVTAELMKLRYGERAARRFHLYLEGDSFPVNKINCRFYPAGHIAGSVMVMFNWKQERVLFTGDWNYSQCGHLTTCEFPETDILITETTFANPQIAHPGIRGEIEKIINSGFKVVAGAYRIGKAQRFNYLLTKFAPEIPIFIHREIIAVHTIYRKNGIETGESRPYHKQQFQNEKRAVYIVPPQILPSFYGARGIETTFVTGWTQWHRNCSFLTNISDHADWNTLLQMIQLANPHTVYTIHGEGKHVKTHFFASGIEVFELK
ncbi:MAG: hypothetical protein LC117_05415 [Bacteroidia bacterium]|nr:hypothetical protein [Bacteroidia bacterium]MCZ2277349.1 hypothetical protein [Bacteroidia bacterium]